MFKSLAPQFQPKHDQPQGTERGSETSDPTDVFYSVQEAAREFGLERHYLGRIIKAGLLPARRQGRTKQIRLSDFLALMEHDITREMLPSKPFPKEGIVRSPSKSRPRAQKAGKNRPQVDDDPKVVGSEPNSKTRRAQGPVVSSTVIVVFASRDFAESDPTDSLVPSQTFEDSDAKWLASQHKRGRPCGRLSHNTPKRITLAAALGFLGYSKRKMRTLLYPESNPGAAEDAVRKLFKRHGKEISREQAGMLRDRAVGLLQTANCNALFPERPKTQKP
jgi:hypothetical protein